MPVLPVFALLLFNFGIALTMADNFELTVTQVSCAAVAAGFAASDQAWMRHAAAEASLTGFDGMRVVVPWAVGVLVVPTLSEVGAVWTHGWSGHDVVLLVGACALFVAASWSGFIGANQCSALETQMIANTSAWFLTFAAMILPMHPAHESIDPVLQTIGFGCAGAAILLYRSCRLTTTTKGGLATYSNDVASDRGEVVQSPFRNPSLKSTLPIAASIALLTLGFHELTAMRAEAKQAGLDDLFRGPTLSPLPTLFAPDGVELTLGPTQPVSPAPLLEASKPGVAPVCLIATWSGPKLPALSYAFIKSLAPSGGEIRLKLFVDGVAPADLPNSTVAPYLEVLTLESIDSSYATRAWPGFISDRVCAYFGAPIGSAACNATEEGLQIGARNTRYPPIMGLRGMYGRLFEEWVGPDKCDSWGWVDTDMLMGDIVGWLASSPEFRNADVATFSNVKEQYGPRALYTCGQFTIHNQRRVPHIVNELWRGCDLLESLAAIRDTFKWNKAFGLDEGCYSKAVFASPSIVATILPWQAADWEKWDYGLILGGRLFVANGCLADDGFDHCRVLARSAAARADPLVRGSAISRIDPAPTVLPTTYKG
ncbi:hypothetical protein BDK51DRAFT_50386, partial [Blyttiomyces helicus]